MRFLKINNFKSVSLKDYQIIRFPPGMKGDLNKLILQQNDIWSSVDPFTEKLVDRFSRINYFEHYCISKNGTLITLSRNWSKPIVLSSIDNTTSIRVRFKKFKDISQAYNPISHRLDNIPDS